MRQRTLAVLIVMFFICARGFAGDSMDKRRVQLEMDERAVQLASKLKISLGQQEHIKKSRRALSSLKIENIENLIFKIDTVHSKLSEIVIERKDALNSQDKVVMVGKIYECDSFEEARVRLLNELVFCSLPIEMIMERYELSQVDIGNLCIVGKIFDMKAQKYLPSDIHFVRGSTMISLRSETTPSVDIYGIAKALDAVLKSLDMKDDVSSAGDLSAAISPKEREAHIEKLRSQYAEMEGKLLDNLYRECKGGSEDKTYFSPLHAAILAVRAWRVARADDARIKDFRYI